MLTEKLIGVPPMCFFSLFTNNVQSRVGLRLEIEARA